MSLPSHAIIFNDGKEVDKIFVNCGWVCDSRSIIRILKEIKETIETEWDKIFLYGDYYPKEEVNKILELDKMQREIWKNKFKN